MENMGEYAVIAEMNGCFSSPTYTSVAIININDFDDFDFPNVITPNGDGVNDSLEINSYYKTCQEYILLIYNRWGQLVYEQLPSSPPFEGNSNDNSNLVDGIYFYRLSSGNNTKAGFIHVIR